MTTVRRLVYPLLCGSGILLSACGGSGSGSDAVFQPPAASLVRVSDSTPFAANCGGATAGGILFENAEVEPYVAVNPLNPSNLVGVWQQDRWSDGGSRGMVSAYSMDSGKTWHVQPIPMSVCAGGNAADGTDYARASDPWISFSPNGTAHAIAIAFTGDALQAGSTSAILVSRSLDGGTTWDKVQTLIADGASAFNDKESITADPGDANYVYAVWDRLTVTDFGPSYFARSTDGGASWEAAHAIYDPGLDNQTLGNAIVVTSTGTLVNMFMEIHGVSSRNATVSIRVIRSFDHGASWSAPTTVAEDQSVGTSDPDTGKHVRASNGLPQIAVGPGNELVITWQDARFNQGKFDGVALSTSSDGGLSWSAPVQVNAVGSAQAFTPSVAVLPDGTIGVTYYDFRSNTSNTSDSATLPTDLWFVSS
ncbi:MAG TPA: sialidase family protein, partial [Gammaproteobacteria bacterium]|nr:sialidase family protein [Gammaproteobacteria bacterium]